MKLFDTSADVAPAALSRRSLITGGLAAGVLIAFHLPVRATNEPVQPPDNPDNTGGNFAPNAFIRIDGDGRMTLVMPQVEMGQGVYTAIAMILAEELDADIAKVVLEHAPPNDKLYGNPVFGLQVTGNSNSIRAWWTALRKAGASARAMLMQAAAAQWQVMPASCTTSKSEVVHADSGRRLGYGALVEAARGETPPKDVPLKDPKDFIYIGQPLKRFDTPSKTNGKAVYGIDAMLPDMKFATVVACPVFGGKVGKVDASAARKVAGVRQVVVLDDMVAVVGDHMWAAKKGVDALKIDWDEGRYASLTTEDIWRDLRSATEKDGVIAKTRGDVGKALAAGERIEASYELPFLAHAAMEPINCTVHLKSDSCELWTGTQIVTRVQSEAAKAAGLPVEKVIVNNHLLGGGFGRKLEPDMAVAAVKIARQLEGPLEGVPLKVVWTREEDMRHDVYRPVYRDVIAATLTDGKISAWKYKVAGAAVLARWLPPAFQKGIDIDAVDCAVDMPYDIADFEVAYVRAEPPAVPTGFWRGVGPNNNVFAVECFIDELARKAGQDPIAFRRAMLGKTPRLQAALDMVAEKSGWGQPLPERVGRGVSVQPAFGSFIATVVEAEVAVSGEVHLRRATSVVDTGIAVNPDTIKAQIEGGMIFSFTAGLYGEITVAKGRVQQSNFHDYRMLRIDQAPKIEVHVVKSGEAPGGIGEAGVSAALPALRNAIYAATGVPLRRMPIDRSLIAAGRKA